MIHLIQGLPLDLFSRLHTAKMDRETYSLTGTENLISPALIYYRDIILSNTDRILVMAEGPEYLWPHVKSHKCAEMIRMQIALGIIRFKCATIAEAEMTAAAGANHIILAYPLIGPNIIRFLKLTAAFPDTQFYAIGDNFDQLSILAAEAEKQQLGVNLLIDVNMGMNRTGISLDLLETFYEQCAILKGITVKGLHCYDGQRTDPDIESRRKSVMEGDIRVNTILDSLKSKGLECELMVMGGTPAFPCRCYDKTPPLRPVYLSPGTLFIGDWTSYQGLPELYNKPTPPFAFVPGAAVFCRVVSHAGPGNTFTIDLGHKGIAADPAGDRGIIAGLPEAKPLFQSEEHWVFTLPENIQRPPIGSDCYVIPAHICPTSALYPEILVAQDGRIVDTWQVDARNRKINY